jgi:hypothetical protein
VDQTDLSHQVDSAIFGPNAGRPDEWRETFISLLVQEAWEHIISTSAFHDKPLNQAPLPILMAPIAETLLPLHDFSNTRGVHEQQLPPSQAERLCNAHKPGRSSLSWKPTGRSDRSYKPSAAALALQADRASLTLTSAVRLAAQLPAAPPYPTRRATWSSGVDHLEHLSELEAWALLGVPKDGIPGLSNLKLRWHQVLGILHLLDNFFHGSGTLLCDEVGLGKTVQILGFFAMLSSNRRAKAAHGRFLGFLGMGFPN